MAYGKRDAHERAVREEKRRRKRFQRGIEIGRRRRRFGKERRRQGKGLERSARTEFLEEKRRLSAFSGSWSAQ